MYLVERLAEIVYDLILEDVGGCDTVLGDADVDSTDRSSDMESRLTNEAVLLKTKKYLMFVSLMNCIKI